MFDVLSPDGMSIDHSEYYPTREAAAAAAVEYANRFQFQGFYSTWRRERVPLDEIAGRCRIIEVIDCEEEEGE